MSRHRFLSTALSWPWPAVTTHSGVPLGNGTFGALVWGGGPDIRCTINRQDYWDHRGGIKFEPEATHRNLRQWLESGDEERVRSAFEGRSSLQDGPPMRPTRLPMGRIDLRLADARPVTGAVLDLQTGEAELALWAVPGRDRVKAIVLRDDPVLIVSAPGGSPHVLGQPPDAPEVVEAFRERGLAAARRFGDSELAGWVQECPGEPAMCAAWLKVPRGAGTDIVVASVYGASPDLAVAEAEALLRRVSERPYSDWAEETADWWREWWDRAAGIQLPDPDRELLYYLGMYKLAGLSVPGSPAATLQGPWVEEYRMPPWSADYHFNINVQECYWPAYGGNHLETLEPLFGMIESWKPKLREQARTFTGIDDGFMLPHAVDDRGTCMGGFWTGAIDHGSTGWAAQLMWLYYRHSMDEAFLRDTAYPFMKGTMRVYEAMLEDLGDELALPVGVSPEFGGADAAAWGRNASFQLAVIHFLCRALIEASERLGIDEEGRRKWSEIDRRLPLGSTSSDGDQLHLWEGQPLAESHRHHSHLAGIYPFDIFDIDQDGEQRRLVINSMAHLTRQGIGQWSGWCVPWASILHARLGNGEMADLLLAVFRRAFMGPGFATLHDAAFPGLTLLAGRPDIMQVEAGMGAAAAVLEMLCHLRGGVLRIFPAVPRDWTDVSFTGLRTEGAFLVSADRRNGATTVVTVHSLAGQPLRLANPWDPSEAHLTDGRGTVRMLSGRVLNVRTEAGQKLEFRSKASEA